MDYDVLDAFSDRDNKMKVFRPASQGKRFGNFIIGQIGIYVLAFVAFFVLEFLNPEAYYGFMVDESLSKTLLDSLLSAILSVLFYSLMEYVTKGKTVGKLMTNTRAIRMDNEQLTFNNALMRSLYRIVPFEPFSFLGSSLRSGHGTWTDTQVIEDDGFVTY